MEIKVLSPTQAQPLPPVQWNYAEVKQWVEDGLKSYDGRIYTEDTIAEAKKDRAALNKLADAVADKRKEMKALYLQPYAQFEGEAKEIEGMIKAVSSKIDAQVKAYDDYRKQEKLEKIKAECYAPMIGNLAALVPYERLHDPKWLNVTCSAGTIAAELSKKIENIFAGLSAIDHLDLAPDMAEQVKGVFLRNFDLATAIAEKDRIVAERAALKRYEEAQQAAVAEETQPHQTAPVQTETPTAPQEQPATDEIITVAFRIRVTREQLDGLGAYMKAHNIKPERVN